MNHRKTMKRAFVASVISIGILFATPADAGWRLYDDFNTGNAVDPTRWSLTERGAASISIENGKLRFETAAGVVDLSENAVMLKSKRKIRGVRVDVQIEKTPSCSGDVRGRIHGYLGNSHDNKYRVWHQLMVRGGMEQIQAGTSYATFDFASFEDLYFATLQHTKVTGRKVRLETTWTKKKVHDKANKADGTLLYKFKKALKPLDKSNLGDFRVALGTRATDLLGSPGSCEILFDNVWVFIP